MTFSQECKSVKILRREPAKTLEVFDEVTALAEAQRCLSLSVCESCDLCQLICPDLCIIKNESTGLPEINYSLCRGCGICAVFCPKNAIKMVPEQEE
jgi:2-oxoacid:acceptor oxidoreductase delta subunit (pyruvate/2-ketoisovalerate family)